MVQFQVAVVGELMMIYLRFGKELRDWRSKLTPKEASGRSSNEKNQTIEVIVCENTQTFKEGSQGVVKSLHSYKVVKRSTGCCCGVINPSLIFDTPHGIQLMARCQ